MGKPFAQSCLELQNRFRLQAQIAQLVSRAETGEQWAEICKLESDYIAATGEQLPVNLNRKEL